MCSMCYCYGVSKLDLKEKIYTRSRAHVCLGSTKKVNERTTFN
jgi:hypothetical protein